MKILILTHSIENYKFIEGELFKQPNREDFLVSWMGKYDFSFDWDYDIGISFMYQHKIPKEQLNKPWFNFHPAPLPEYKGRNLCYHAIINGEKEFGATLHYMDKDFDTGDIIQVLNFPLSPSNTAENISKQTITASKDLFVQYFPRILSGENFPRVKNRSGYYYYKKPIDDFIEIAESNKTRIRAITYGEFYPKINIGGVIYKIVRDE